MSNKFHKLSALILLCCCSLSALSQNIILTDQCKPIEYKKFDGKLMVRSYIKFDRVLDSDIELKLDDKTINDIFIYGDSVSMWMPMIGSFNRISVLNKGIHVTEIMVEAPISDDWGYFKEGMIHIMQSSHQDIGWMNTPEYCRNERIEDIVKPALSNMEKDPSFAFEMEQSLNLMEFLERYPERKNEIIKRYKEGRFTWGGTYTQPYEGILSGEQLVRQVYYGRKWIKDSLGCDETTAYNIDVPSRALQVPQIFAKSGIKTLFISRMYDGFYHWYSPDGTKLTTFACSKYDFPHDVLCYFSEDAFTAMKRINPNIRLASDSYAKYKIANQYPIVMSCDANTPMNLQPIIDEWNRIVDLSDAKIPHMRLSTAEQYFNTVEKDDSEFQKVYGERPNLWLYIHGTAHHKMYSDKRRAAVVLPSAEILSSVADQILNDGEKYPSKDFFRAWMASIYPDHGIGGYKGNITDSIFADSLHVAKVIGEEKLKEVSNRFANNINTKKGNIIVFNDLLWNRNDVVQYSLTGDLEKSKFMFSDSKGVNIPYQITKGNNGEKYVCFIANVPSLGYSTIDVDKTNDKKVISSVPQNIKQGDNFYNGEYYDVVLGNGGIVSLYDKELGREIAKKDKYALGDILSIEYTGNGAGEFVQIKQPETVNMVPPFKLPYTLTSSKQSVWKITETGPVFTSFECETDMEYAIVFQRITIYHEIKKIDIDVTLKDFNGAHNRQFRILFPIDNEWRNSDINYEVPYAVAKVGKDEMDRPANGYTVGGTYDFNPNASHPREIQNFISASGNGIGFTLASDVNTADWIDPGRNKEYYTVLQGVLLSSHHSCHGLGEWYSQEGTHNYHFSIIGHNVGWENGYKYALESNHPYTIVEKANKGGNLPANQSLIKISDPLVSISTLKKADNNNGYILRLVEMEGKDKELTITFPFEIKKIIKTNLIEEDEQPIDGSGNTLTIKIGHHSIEAYRLITNS